MTYASESSKIMCMDKVFVDLVNTYYRTGLVDWLSEEQMDKIVGRADDLKHSLCGNQAPNITLPGWISQSGLASTTSTRNTPCCAFGRALVAIAEEMPKLERIYETWKPRGLEIFAIGNDFEPEPWKEYVKEKASPAGSMSATTHSSTPRTAPPPSSTAASQFLSLNFRTTFDVYATPKMLLLDEDKNIIAQVGATQLAEILSNLKALKKPFPTLTWTNNGRVPRANIDPHWRRETHPNEEEGATGLLFMHGLLSKEPRRLPSPQNPLIY